MRKPILYYLAGVLSAIAVPLALWGILYSAVGGSDYDVISTSTSPDKKYVATVYSSMGGGAAGWCSIRATVNPTTEPFSIEREKNEGKYVVFNVNCGSEVEAQWETNKNLLITYKNLNNDFGITVYKKPIDWYREVKIRYIEE
jgi:hypothetical protein